MKYIFATLALATAFIAGTAGADDSTPEPVTVFAASSLTDVLGEQAKNWSSENKRPMPRLSFGASATMARQIMSGAPADLMLSANPAWVFTLSDEGLLKTEPVALVKNSLVLVMPGVSLPATPERAVSAQLVKQATRGGRLAIADPAVAPAGAYAKNFLEQVGLWTELEPRVAISPNVRRTLLLVERGGLPGFVYSSDARASKYVTIVGTVPEDAGNPILYMAGLTKDAAPDADQFLAYLIGVQARAVWEKYGFVPLDLK
ncbi:MAG: molybdate ABC transporter substrate-binding protein [Alphaproteobacteria bacterium]|nr:MAG: molybdate ABC transporter substrate-binding protein [Alphaproteobacteria bacterium]